MKVEIPYSCGVLCLELPDFSFVYKSTYGEPSCSAERMVMEAAAEPVASPGLSESLKKRSGRGVVIAVSDITRPIPYREFLPALLRFIESNGISRDEITILIATGMHRPSTAEEHLYMFGRFVAENYRILDHDAEGDLAVISGRTQSGGEIKINRFFAEAGYKITIGLVEPHFMAGFSGGRKTLCPGLSSLDTIKNFHGYEFLSNPGACAANLHGNPCHDEALSVAAFAGVDFSINVVLNSGKKIIRVFAGEIVMAHKKACEYVRGNACPPVRREADVVITGCGGYPLDATFYQCTKSLVTSLPCVKKSGIIIAAGGCIEGIGSETYREMLRKYNNDYRSFLNDIKVSETIVKDQWQIQMQARFDSHVGWRNVHFYCHGIVQEESGFLGVKAF